jgi:tetratricopeptide (TPR) repeat protein/transcriptional regulator with XRE-family HTH domain
LVKQSQGPNGASNSLKEIDAHDAFLRIAATACGTVNSSGSADTSAFGAALRHLRGEKGLSLTALSRQLHYSKGYLSKVENGERPATAKLAMHCDQVLAAGGSLARLAPEQTRARGGPRRPAQLPAAPADFTGRETAIAWLDDACRTHAIMVISGPPGVGKTALALHWAELAASRLPHGSLFADLRGYTDRGKPAEPNEVLEGFLRALGTAAEAIPAGLEVRSALLRTHLHGKRMLVLLDNAAASEQVRPLLPGAGACRVLVTSRSLLSGLATREGAARCTLRALPEDEALALFRHVLGTERVAREPQAASALAYTCGYLPLALRIAADRAYARPRLSLTALAGQLAASSERLDLLATVDDESTAVRAVFSWSYRMLAPGVARVFRLLGLHHGHDVGIPATAALAAISPHQARRMLDVLAGASLLEESGPDRYRFHDLIRLYAAEVARAEETHESREAAIRRLLLWYLHTAAAADRVLAPQRRHPGIEPSEAYSRPLDFADYAQALDWYDTECANLASLASQAAESGQHAMAWQLPNAAWSYFALRKPWAEWIRACQAGLTGAQRGRDKTGEAWMLSSLSAAYNDLGRYEESRDCCVRALDIRRQLGDQHGECSCLHNLGILCRQLKMTGDAIVWSQRALTLSRHIGNRRAAYAALTNLGETYRDAERYEEALGCFQEALHACRQIGDSYAEAHVLDGIGATCLALSHFDRARDTLTQALHARQAIGDRHGEATTLLHLGELYRRTGMQDDATRQWRDALTICEELRDPRADEFRKLLRDN